MARLGGRGKRHISITVHLDPDGYKIQSCPRNTFFIFVYLMEHTLSLF